MFISNSRHTLCRHRSPLASFSFAWRKDNFLLCRSVGGECFQSFYISGSFYLPFFIFSFTPLPPFAFIFERCFHWTWRNLQRFFGFIFGFDFEVVVLGSSLHVAFFKLKNILYMTMCMLKVYNMLMWIHLYILIAIVAIGSTSIRSHNYHFFLWWEN